MSEDKANGRKPRGWARFGFWFGAAVSTAANIASTVVHYGSTDYLAIGWSMVAPIALLIVVEIMARPGKPKPVAVPVAPETVVRVVPEPVVQAQQVVAAEVTRLQAPVSPAPQQGPERRVTTRSGPGVDREVISPLTGRVLTERPPKA